MKQQTPFKILINLFFRGLIILGPIGVTVYVIFLIFTSLDGLIPNLPIGIGFLIVLGAILIVGYLGTRFFLGRWIVEGLNYLLEHTPGIKFIYSSVKEILDSFMGDKKKFNDPVWVCTNRNPELWRIGFLTQQQVKDMHPDMVAVYLPHSYAISGWVIVVNRSQIKTVTSMTAAEAMKFAVSGGVAGGAPELIVQQGDS